MHRRNTDKILITGTHAELLADPTVYTANFELSPTDTADAGKHKLCDNIHTYAGLSFIEDGGVGGGMTELTGAVTAGPGTGSQAATIPGLARSIIGRSGTTNGAAVPIQGLAVIGGQPRQFPANGALGISWETLVQTDLPNVIPAVYFATFTNEPPPVVTNEYNQLGGSPVIARVDGGHFTLTITGAFTAGKTYAAAGYTGTGDALVMQVVVTSVNVIDIYDFDPAGDPGSPVDPMTIKVEVYPL